MSLIDKLASIKQYRDEIREAIEAKGGNLPEGSHMSDYADAINEISGGEVDFSKINGVVQELELQDGVVVLKDIGGNTLVLPQEPHTIGRDFLQGNKSITTLINTEYITGIGASGFSGSGISGEHDFSNLTEIGHNAFQNSNISGDLSLPKLTTLVSTTSYSGYQFGSTNITSADMPLVEKLPYNTLYYCRALKFINIPNIKTIHYSAFYSVNRCETIILGETIPTVEGGTSFQYFLTGNYSPNCKIQVPPYMVDAYKEDTFWSQYADRIIPYPEPKPEPEPTEGYIIGEGLTIIEYAAFKGAGLTGEITIADSVTTIELSAFGDNQITSVVFPDSLTSIGISAFMNNQLTSVVIPDSVTSIENYAFYINPLTEVSIGPNTTYESDSFPDNAIITVREN